ncbi:hypothetical protein PDJAM_G00120950 [Pangasius djambal]|uniref:Uncharacterized protein n=1 Tax=Pangasius djambal TaxID=1691987 RepID=A0ACC5ZAE1_9TELE|nr:hypothetical protein [Pangasius djambal]
MFRSHMARTAPSHLNHTETPDGFLQKKNFIIYCWANLAGGRGVKCPVITSRFHRVSQRQRQRQQQSQNEPHHSGHALGHLSCRCRWHSHTLALP